MNKMIAYCGLICSDCEAYVATQAGDQAALEQVAAKWRQEYNAPNLTVDGVPCDGCLVEGRKSRPANISMTRLSSGSAVRRLNGA